MSTIAKARYLTYFLEYAQRKYSSNAGDAKESPVISLLPGQIKDRFFKVCDLSDQQIYPLKPVRSIHHYQGMREPLYEVIIISLFDLIARTGKNAFSEQELTERAVLAGAQADHPHTPPEQITHNRRRSWINVDFWNRSSPQQLRKGESITAVSLDLSRSEHRKAKPMGEANVKAKVGKTINKPVSVESAFDDDLQGRSERLKQIRDARQLVRSLLLKVDRKIHINYTQMRASCTQINTGSEAVSFLKDLVCLRLIISRPQDRLY